MELTSGKTCSEPLRVLTPGNTGGFEFRELKPVLNALALPLVLLALAYSVLSGWTGLTGRVYELAYRAPYLFQFAPYLLLLAGLALSWRFNRSRAFYVMATLLLAHWAVQQQASLAPLQSKGLLLAVGLFLPANILLFAWLRERGIFTVRGLTRLCLIGVQVAVVLLLLNPDGEGVLREAVEFFTAPFDRFGVLHYWRIPQALQVVFVVALLGLLLRVIMRPTALNGGLFAALLAVVFGMDSDTWIGGAVYISVAALILLVATVQDSYCLAYQDELTGLPGRRALNEHMQKLSGRYVMVMVDVDHFKKFNDLFGHETGDQVLRFVAARLQRVRGGGKAYRYGGEEFTLLFPGKRVEDVRPCLEQVHEAIGASRFILRARNRPRQRPSTMPPVKRPRRKVAVTVSMGMAQRDGRIDTPQRVLKAADQALYRAKQQGRNRIVH